MTRATDSTASERTASERTASERTVSERTGQVIAAEASVLAHNYHPLPIVVASAEGAWVTDVDGRRYLDCLAAYSAVNC